MELVKTEDITPLEAFEQELERLAPATASMYRRWLNSFLEYVKGTPQELIDTINKSENRALALKSVRLTLEKYQDQLVADGLKPITVKTASKAVSKFLSANEINDFRIKARRGSSQSTGKRVLLKDQVLSLYQDAGRSRRLRALILTMKDTGLRPSDIVKLSVDDYLSAERIKTDDGEFRRWVKPVTTQKNGVCAYVHLGPESVRAVDDYILNRTTGPIFLIEREHGDTKPGDPMMSNNVTTVIRNLCRHLKKKGFNVAASSLRKFFMTNLSTKIELAYVKTLCGKALSATDAPYLQAAQTGQLTKLYVENYDALKIFEDTHQIKELKTLRQELDELRDYVIKTEDQPTILEEFSTYQKMREYEKQLEAQGYDEDTIYSKLEQYMKEMHRDAPDTPSRRLWKELLEKKREG